MRKQHPVDGFIVAEGHLVFDGRSHELALALDGDGKVAVDVEVVILDFTGLLGDFQFVGRRTLEIVLAQVLDLVPFF